MQQKNGCFSLLLQLLYACMSNIVTAATEESWWQDSVSLRYVYSKYMHYGVNRLLIVLIYLVISQKK